MSLMKLSRPTPTVWVIELNAPPDNRLHPNLLTELGANLDKIEAEWRAAGGAANMDPKKRGEHGGAGAVVLTAATPKFFSNGLHPSSLGDIGGFFENVYDPLAYRLMTFPLVTIAALNGHAFAGGFVLSLCCDYRIMTGGRGMLSMNEVFMGLPLPNAFNVILRQRMDYQTLRETLMGKRWTQKEALAKGIIDEIVDDTGANEGALLKRAIALGMEKGPIIGAGAWGALKDGVWHEAIDASRARRQIMLPAAEAKAFKDRLARQSLSAKL